VQKTVLMSSLSSAFSQLAQIILPVSVIAAVCVLYYSCYVFAAIDDSLALHF